MLSHWTLPDVEAQACRREVEADLPVIWFEGVGDGGFLWIARPYSALRQVLCRVPSGFDWQTRPRNLSLLWACLCLSSTSQLRQDVPDDASSHLHLR